MIEETLLDWSDWDWREEWFESMLGQEGLDYMQVNHDQMPVANALERSSKKRWFPHGNESIYFGNFDLTLKVTDRFVGVRVRHGGNERNEIGTRRISSEVQDALNARRRIQFQVNRRIDTRRTNRLERGKRIFHFARLQQLVQRSFARRRLTRMERTKISFSRSFDDEGEEAMRTFSSWRSSDPWNDPREELEDHRTDHLSSARSTQEEDELHSPYWSERSADNRRVDSMRRTDRPVRSARKVRSEASSFRRDRSMSSTAATRRSRRTMEEHYLRTNDERERQRETRDRYHLCSDCPVERAVRIGREQVRENLAWKRYQFISIERTNELTESFIVIFTLRRQAKENRAGFLQFFVQILNEQRKSHRQTKEEGRQTIIVSFSGSVTVEWL